MSSDRSLASLTSHQDLRTIYEQPNPIVLNKVLDRFDRHAATFIAAARFAAINVEGPDGVFVPVLAGGAPGFARLIDESTLAIDVAPHAWSAIDMAPSPAAHPMAIILIVPGIKETLRCKGSATTEGEAATGGPSRRVLVRIDNSFFHCAKALMRSRVWDAPRSSDRWKGLRTFRCVRKIRESALVASFHFVPADGGAPPSFQPGQHIPLEIARPDGGDPLRRTYSLSNRPGEDTIRITVKREAAPAGGSALLHDAVDVDDVVRMRNPGGSFVLDQDSRRPVVLLSAGVGLTPMIAMLDHLVAAGSERRLWFLHSTGSGRDHVMGAHVRDVARRHGNVRAHVHYTRPRPEDVLGRDYDDGGRLSVDVLKRLLPWDDYEFYVCGPGPFMKVMIEGLLGNGVLPERVRWEAFSADGLDIAMPAAPPSRRDVPRPEAASGVGEAQIEFARSGKVVAWTAGSGTLLEVAEASGVAVRSGCRTGECFTCAARVVSGEVAYLHELDDPPDDGTALICCAVPNGPVVLDH